jgi:hypothetical protein
MGGGGFIFIMLPFVIKFFHQIYIESYNLEINVNDETFQDNHSRFP